MSKLIITVFIGFLCFLCKEPHAFATLLKSAPQTFSKANFPKIAKPQKASPTLLPKKSQKPPPNQLMEAHAKKAAYLLGALGVSSLASTQLMVWVNPDLEFWPTYGNTLVGQLAVLTVIPLAPFMEPVTSTIRRKAFSATQDKTQQMARNSLEQQYDRLNAMYTLQEQNSIDRILNFRSTIRWNFQAAKRAVDRGDAQTAIAEIGDAAMIGYHQFREVHPNESTVLNMVRTSFLHNLQSPEQYVEPVLKYIQRRDPDVFAGGARKGELLPKDYYQKAVKAWLTSSVN